MSTKQSTPTTLPAPRPTGPTLPGKLPSITRCLNELELCRFVMPKPGDGILSNMLSETAGPVPSLAGTGMVLRKLELSGRQVIPVHCHLKRSKLYHQISGCIRIFIWQKEWNEKPDSYIVDAEAEKEEIALFAVPAGRPHAVACWGCDESEGDCVTYVVSAPDDPADIFWEEGAEKLCLNARARK